ncbi:MAG: DJ-1/PfpI family protein [Nannocystaceae bacterium]|nr:DJ-1/PfpI family protein [Nannocystaceae bacterium]
MIGISFLTFDDVQALDVCGPLEVFATANELGRHNRYETRILSPAGAPVRATNGLRWVVDGRWEDLPNGATMVVPGGQGIHALRTPEIADRIGQLGARAGRIASVCTGSYLLAEAGLLEGKRASTHWAKEDDFASAFPGTTLDRDSLYQTQDESKPVWTSAGVSAGMDMALAMLERDAGPQLAHEVAQWLVLSLRRRGDEAQRNTALKSQALHIREVARVQAFVRNNPAGDLRVDALAQRANMSVRNFTRRFSRETGMSPAQFVREARCEHARRLLAASDRGIEEVAQACGFQSRQALRRAMSETAMPEGS